MGPNLCVNVASDALGVVDDYLLMTRHESEFGGGSLSGRNREGDRTAGPPMASFFQTAATLDTSLKVEKTRKISTRTRVKISDRLAVTAGLRFRFTGPV